jgi:hypothetical protein
MSRFSDVVEVWQHKMAFAAVRNENFVLRRNISFLRVVKHDLGKLVMIAIVGDKIATMIHRKVAGHHNFRCEADMWEAACDWECARITKPAKPLNGRQTWERFYSFLDMEKMFDQAGL